MISRRTSWITVLATYRNKAQIRELIKSLTFEERVLMGYNAERMGKQIMDELHKMELEDD